MKLLSQIDQFIRSLIFSIIMIVATVFYSLLSILAKPLPFRYRHAMIMAWILFIVATLKLVCRVNYHVEGLENIPKDRVGIILSKHQSMWETFFLPPLFQQTAIILKQELLWVPFFGWGLAITDPIAINRKDPGSAMEQIIIKGKKYLAEGRWILVFPEGTRIPAGEVGKYRSGGARLATATGHPVLPVAHNAGYYWPKRKFLKKPGTIQVVLGPLIETKGRNPEEVMAEAKEWIETTVKRIGK
jgi:1-acyl-sn-glycerol-3-phosphate acyltransferase